MILKLTLFFLLLINFSVYSQLKINISGNITIENKNLSDAIVELKINQSSKFSVSNKKGIFQFNNISTNKNDSIFLKVNYIRTKPFVKKLNNLLENNILNINLLNIEPENLKEVVVKGKENTIISSKKASYKIDQKDYIKNTKAGEVLNNVPNVNYSLFQENAIVDGTLTAIIFIDGIETMQGELKTVDAIDIDRVEVINNPSSALGSEFLGAVINIITKKKTQEFIKGSFGSTAGVKNNYWFVTPSISYKKGIVTLKSFLEPGGNNQIINYDLLRSENNNTLVQKNTNSTKTSRFNSSTKLNLKFSDKSNLTFTNSIYGYRFNPSVNGFSKLNNDISQIYNKTGENSIQTISISTIYIYKLSDNKNIFTKANYSILNNKDYNLFNFNNIVSINDVQSSNKEFATSIDYEAEDLTLFKKNGSFYTDVKYINRNFNFAGTNFYINQNILDLTAEIDNDWSENFSTDATITLDNTIEKSNISKKNYSLILPVVNGIYHFKNKIDAKIGYSRKILRPSASDLNDTPVFINPNLAKQGNSNLYPQLRNYYSFSISKAFKKDNISIKFYQESINNAITDVYKTQSSLVIQTLENAAKFSSSGLTIGFKTKLFSKINANINSGFDYNLFEDKSNNAIVQKKSGYTFRGNFNLNTKLFKDKISVSVSGRQNGPNYSLLAKRVTFPYLDLTVSTNLIKDKLSLTLYGQSLLGNNYNGFDDITNYNNFYQKINARNNSSNLLLTLTYNFGKVFDDKIDDNGINNDDIRK